MKIRRVRWATEGSEGGGESGKTEVDAVDDKTGDGENDVQTPITEETIQTMIQTATEKLSKAHKEERAKLDRKISELQGEKMTAEERLEAEKAEVEHGKEEIRQREVKLEATKALATAGLGVEWAELVSFPDQESIPKVVKMIKDSMSVSVKTQVTEHLKAAGIKPKSGGGTTPDESTGRKNPWDKKNGTWNLTDQMKIIREDPALAAKMKAAAG